MDKKRADEVFEEVDNAINRDVILNKNQICQYHFSNSNLKD
jgi:hypothetical protein